MKNLAPKGIVGQQWNKLQRSDLDQQPEAFNCGDLWACPSVSSTFPRKPGLRQGALRGKVVRKNEMSRVLPLCLCLLGANERRGEPQDQCWQLITQDLEKLPPWLAGWGARRTQLSSRLSGPHATFPPRPMTSPRACGAQQCYKST